MAERSRASTLASDAAIIAPMEEARRRLADDPRPRVLLLRRVASVVAGAYVGSWIPALAVRFLDIGPAVGWSLLVAGAALGGYAGYREAQRLVPFDAHEHRDAVIGWSVVLALVGVVVSLLLPAPWRFLVAIAWVALVVFVARSLVAPTVTN